MFGFGKKAETAGRVGSDRAPLDQGNGNDDIRFRRTQEGAKSTERDALRRERLAQIASQGAGVASPGASREVTAAVTDEIARRVGEPGAPVVRVVPASPEVTAHQVAQEQHAAATAGDSGSKLIAH